MDTYMAPLISFAKKLKSYRIFKPIIPYAKRYVYNAYIKSRLVDIDFPKEVWIENTNACNARCVMCPRDKLTRRIGFMDFPLYEKLIKEISTFRDRVDRVHLHNYGEPLLDKDISRRIRLAKDYGIKHTYFVTNASMLTPEMSMEIIESGLDEFKVSFYGTDKETYDNTMVGLHFEKTLQNIEAFFRIRKEFAKHTPKVILQYLPMEYNRAKIDEFVNIMRPLINEDAGDSLNICSLHNYGEGRPYIKPGMITMTCGYPWRTMVVLHNGDVVLCCVDFNGAQVVGDVKTSTIKEIWNSTRYKDTRRDFRELKYNKYPICRQCNVIL